MTLTFLFATHSLIKWYLTKICFVFSWLTGFWDIAIAAVLSSKIVIGVLADKEVSNSDERRRKWIASWHAAHKAWYSAWAEDKVTE